MGLMQDNHNTFTVDHPKAESSNGNTTGGMEYKTSDTSDDTFVLIAAKKAYRKFIDKNYDEPLVDKTASLALHSKKTDRLEKKRMKKTTVRKETPSLSDLPPELFHEILGHLRPSDVMQVQLINRATYNYVRLNRDSIASNIIKRSYWVLSHTFPLPVHMSKLNTLSRASLCCSGWQDRTAIHRNPYQHVRSINQFQVCTCMSCLFAWNNLCMVLDLAHFQRNLRQHEPIPMIPRGSNPEWNQKIINENARIVEMAIDRPLVYAVILETHLATIVETLTRRYRMGKRTFHPRKLYSLSDQDIAAGTDEFLERHGEPSYEFPFHRDKYYDLEAYVPNRKWSSETGAWQYATPGKAHESDLAWVVKRFKPSCATEYDLEHTYGYLRPR